MKKTFVIIASILAIYLFLLFIIEERKAIHEKEKKIIINYKFSPKGVEIEEYNNSEEEVIMVPENFLLYREKYKDTHGFHGFQNGEHKKIATSDPEHGITCALPPPPDKTLYVFDQIRFKGLNKERQKTIMMSLKVDSLGVPIFEKTPWLHSIMPKSKIILEYKSRLPLEKGKYVIFMDTKDRDKSMMHYPPAKQFKILKSREIRDNPLEFEVK